jgi:hypothetical protein
MLPDRFAAAGRFWHIPGTAAAIFPLVRFCAALSMTSKQVFYDA